MPTPISRNIERVRINPDGSKVVRVYSGPKYWQDEAGNLSPITQERVASVSKLGAMELQRGVAFVGIRKDILSKDRANKLVGLRPDNKQAGGTRQVEFSLEDFTVDGQTVALDLSKHEQVQPGVIDLGNVLIQTTSMRTRIITKIEGCSKDFNISKTIHITGYRVEYRANLDEYWLYDIETGEFGYRFVKPKLINLETYQPLGNAEGEEHLLGLELVRHTFDPATGIYTKVPGEDFDPAILPKSYGIDVETVYSTTADGYIYASNADWATVRGATWGNYNRTATNEWTTMAAYWTGTVISIFRAFLYPDYTGLSGTVESVDCYIRGQGNAESNACVQLGTQADAIVNEDMDAFSGSEYGHTAGWTAAGYNKITFNAQGISDVQSALGGIGKICLREYDHDYSNVSPGTSTFRNGMRFTEYADTTFDPYLEITLAAGGSVMPIIMLQHDHFNGGIMQ